MGARDGDSTLPLDGLRVVDLSRHMAGPYATVVLGDYGADVVKVESLEGDGSRQTGVDYLDGESAIFLQWNRGKRSVSVDYRTPDGRALVHDLVRDADVFLENYRPGVADALGFGYDELRALNERLLYCSVSGFGPDGPLRELPATDPVVQAMSGVMSVTGERGGEPVLVGVPVADFTGAMVCVQAILLGLAARERTGRGQKLDVSMLFALMSSLTTRLASYWATGRDPERLGGEHSVVVPYQTFATADGAAVAGAWGEPSWRRFCEALELPELVDDPRFATNVGRAEHRAELVPLLARRFRERTTAEWDRSFRACGALFGPVLGFGELLAHPHVREAGLVVEAEHRTLGPIPQLGPVIGLSETPGRVGSAPPLLGEHTAEVLRELGYEEARIRRLVDSGIVRVHPAAGS